MAPLPSTDAGQVGTGKPPADPTRVELRYSHEHHWAITHGDVPETWHVSADVPDTEDKDGRPAASHVDGIEIVLRITIVEHARSGIDT